jgi:hypothetical protein
LRPNDPLAQGSEARAAFCSAKRLEDVKTTREMKNIDAGMEPVSNPVWILRRQAIEARRYDWKMKNHRQGIAGGSGGSL